MAQRFRGAFIPISLISAATVATIAGQFNKLGEYKVVAGESVEPGYQVFAAMDNAVGRIHAKMSTAVPAEVKGTLRLELMTPQDRWLETIFETRTEVLNVSSADRTKQSPFPECGIIGTEDKKFVLSFKPDVDAVIARANCEIMMDITIGSN